MRQVVFGTPRQRDAVRLQFDDVLAEYAPYVLCRFFSPILKAIDFSFRLNGEISPAALFL
jgi:hypothetical protein